jgi:hypothetical protein
MTSFMKRFLPFVACVLGLAALFALLPVFSSTYPRPINITREEASRIADRAIGQVGVDVTKMWRATSWEQSAIIEQEIGANRDLRRQAAQDPVVGPRLGGYYIVYFHRGLEKFPPAAEVYVSAETGAVMGVRRRARNEERGKSPTAEQLRPIADRIALGGKLPGVDKVTFESARPNIVRDRTDWSFRYDTPTTFPMGRVRFLVGVYFIGDKYAGWLQLEEYTDGSYSRSDGSEIAGTILRYVTIYITLIVLLLLFLKKYHAGEVGVGTGALLFAVVVVTAVAVSFLYVPPSSIGTGFGSGLDAFQTAIAMGSFKFLFYDIPIAVLVFFAWSVGESFARERWGEKLASFDAILRRDPFNATVGRSLLRGLLWAPVVTAAALLVNAIPIWLGVARPAYTTGTYLILGLGGPVAALLTTVIEAIAGSVLMLLFILAFFKRQRMLLLGIIVAGVVGSLGGIGEGGLAPNTYLILFGFGATLAAALIYLYTDLLTAATAIFFGALTLYFAPYLQMSGGTAFTSAATTFAIPIAATALFAIAAMLTRREYVYTYESLAPHVRRIVERERVKAEIDAANRIQAALLPLDAPSLAGAAVASHYRAATEIGGDYFDFLPQPNGEIGIAFGDVSGHGLTSGIVMAMAKAALLVQVDYDASPRAVLDVLNEIVIRTAPRRIMMTFFFGLLDPRSQTLKFSSAGHLDPYVYRAKTKRIESLSSWGYPLGIRRREAFREHSVDFDSGDRLVLYSDGLIEAIDDDGEPFGFERFEKTIRDNGHLNADEIKKAVLGAVKKFTHNRPPEDDQTLVVVAFEEVTTETVLHPRNIQGVAVGDAVN